MDTITNETMHQYGLDVTIELENREINSGRKKLANGQPNPDHKHIWHGSAIVHLTTDDLYKALEASADQALISVANSSRNTKVPFEGIPAIGEPLRIEWKFGAGRTARVATPDSIKRDAEKLDASALQETTKAMMEMLCKKLGVERLSAEQFQQLLGGVK